MWTDFKCDGTGKVTAQTGGCRYIVFFWFLKENKYLATIVFWNLVKKCVICIKGDDAVYYCSLIFSTRDCVP